MNKYKRMIAALFAVILCFSISDSFLASEQDDRLRYGEREEWTVIATDYVTKTVTPDGQPSGGTRFSTGGGLYVSTSGGHTISPSLSVAWGYVSISMSVGYVRGNSVDALFLLAPNTTDYFIAKIDKTYKVEYKKVDVYKYNIYDHTYYISVPTLYQQTAYLVAVEE